VEPRRIDRRKHEIRQPSVDSVAESVHDAQDNGALFGVGGADFAVEREKSAAIQSSMRDGWMIHRWEGRER
jgi:hypothetical protein